MTKAEVQALIDSKLASNSEILAEEHREVETAILDYIDNIVTSMPLIRGSITLTDIPSTGKLFDCDFAPAPPLDSNDYIVAGSLYSLAQLDVNGNCIYTVTGKTASGFAIYVKELNNSTQNSLKFDYVVFSK
jgi:hypothetical protein